MNKKAIEPITTIIIILGILLIGGITTGIISVSSPPFCNDKPLNFKCLCLEGEVKTGFFPWKCEKLPELPKEVTFPIETWTEAIVYTTNLLEGFPCTGVYQYDNPLTGELFKQCDKYGGVITSFGSVYKGHIIMMECRSIETVDEEGKPTGGYIVYSVRFDPNDGHVYELSCKEDLISCPETQFTNNWKVDPQPTCGDTCCHSGETFENCPEDCEAPSTEQELTQFCNRDEFNRWTSIFVGKTKTELSKTIIDTCASIGGDARSMTLTDRIVFRCVRNGNINWEVIFNRDNTFRNAEYAPSRPTTVSLGVCYEII